MAATDITTAPSHDHAPIAGLPLLARIYALLTVLVGLWATSVHMFGIPGLYLPALAMVPVIWVILLIISRG